MTMLSREWVQKKIKELGLRPGRGNGQNFLINPHALSEIIAAGTVHAGDTVLEIGAGLGALTEALLAVGAHVTAIELDERLAAYTAKNFPAATIISGDALAVCNEKFLSALGPYKLIANIPYNITSDIIRHFVEHAHAPCVAALLIQKEVARRVTALPPHMNMLALFTQWYARATYVATIPAAHFWPAPVVDSAIVRLEPGAGEKSRHSVAPEDEKKLFSLIKRGFAHPRKQLGNNISAMEKIRVRNTAKRPRLISIADIDLCRRAETLTHAEWITLLTHL